MTAAPAPAVSVVIPCFDSAAFLAETVESVLAQTLPDIEIVLVDDGSRDATPALIGELIAAHPRRSMRGVRQENAGVAAARNAGIREARGRYILPLDADDLIAPSMLEECAALLEAEARAALVYTDREDFGDVHRIHAAGKFELRRLKYFNQVGYSCLYRRSMWEALGGYRVNVSGLDDWDFWLAAAARGFEARHLPRPHLKHRRRATSALWGLLPRYEHLHARIILNNREAYDAAEIESARAFLEEGTPSPLLRSCRFVFMNRYYEGYEKEVVSGTTF